MKIDRDALSNFIRQIDGNNTMGAGELAERIADHLETQTPKIPPRWAQKLHGFLHNGLTVDAIRHLRNMDGDMSLAEARGTIDAIRLVRPRYPRFNIQCLEYAHQATVQEFLSYQFD